VYDYVPGKAAWLAMDLPFEGQKGPETRSGAVADRDAPTCGLDDSVGDVPQGYCVVVHDGLVLGILAGDAYAGAWKTAAEVMSAGPSTFRPSVPREELAGWLDDHDRDRTIITTLDGRLVGTVQRADL
jgi:hypothetical protein